MAHRQHIEWGQITTKPERLDQPLHWRKPQIVAVGFMSDIALWPDEFLDKVFAVMALTPQHTYVLLTKRPERMREYLRREDHAELVYQAARHLRSLGWPTGSYVVPSWPLPNVWLGVSVENQQAADERIPLLLETPAAHRWLSVEPLLEAVNLSRYLPSPLHRLTGRPMLDWVVVGGESGPKARECDVEWIADIARQCEAADVKRYVKQDSGPRPGMQGRLPDALWAVKQLPGGWA
jgi:protein gp37